MKHLKKIIFVSVVVGLLTSTAFIVGAKNVEHNDALAIQSATVTLHEAVMTALKLVLGKAVKAAFSNDDQLAVWEVEIVSVDQQVYDLEIDANHGTVVKHSLDNVDNESDE